MNDHEPNVPLSINFEVQLLLLLAIEFFLRCFIGVPLAKTRVKFLRNPVGLSLSEILHAATFRDVLSDQAVGIFIREIKDLTPASY